jgi:hypothetical protein
MNAKKRRYRGAEFGVNIATSVAPQTFYRIESLATDLGVSRSEIIRRLVLRGLAECQRDGQLPGHTEIPADEQTAQFQVFG